MSEPPTVSVIVPCYLSHRTIAECLRHIDRQTVEGSEVIVVDSSPDDRTREAVQQDFPHVHYIRSKDRLLPHAARNKGVEGSSGSVLVFTDPDIYARTDWLEKMIAAHAERGGVIVGAVGCYNDDWLRRSIHITKFDMWLPGGDPRPVQISMTGSMMIERATFYRLGGFDGSRMLADTLFSWCLEKRGISKTLIPGAVVDHDHDVSLRSFLGERCRRGHEFAELRKAWEAWGPARAAGQLLVTLLPVRLLRLVWRGIASARKSESPGPWVQALPILVLGQGAWLLGELIALLGGLAGRSSAGELLCES